MPVPEIGGGARKRRRVRGALLAATTALWLGLALGRHGVFWPDEIFQSLEPAHRLVFGYGFVSWEFQLGARSWLFPGFLAGLLEGAALVGVATPADLVALVKIAMVLVGLTGVFCSLRLAEALARPGAEAGAGWFAVALAGAFPVSLVLAGRALSETAAGAALGFAALWVARSAAAPSPRWLAGAGALAAVAVTLRPGCAVVAAGLLALVLRVKIDRGRRSGAFLLGAGAVLLLAGLLDWLTWGAPFHALVLYLRYNLIEGHAADYGTAPASFYAVTLARAVGPALPVLLAGLALVPASGRGLLAVVGADFVVLSLLPHKELRFVVPAFPITLGLAAAGLDRGIAMLAGKRGPWRGLSGAPGRAALAALLAAALGLRAPRLTNGDLGRLEHDEQWEAAAGAANDGYNRLLLRLFSAPDLCGLAVAHAAVIWMGGYAYLHRNVPFFELDPPDPNGSPAANYVLAPSAWPAPPRATLVARQGEAALYHYDRPCRAPPPGFDRFELPPSVVIENAKKNRVE